MHAQAISPKESIHGQGADIQPAVSHQNFQASNFRRSVSIGRSSPEGDQEIMAAIQLRSCMLRNEDNIPGDVLARVESSRGHSHNNASSSKTVVQGPSRKSSSAKLLVPRRTNVFSPLTAALAFANKSSVSRSEGAAILSDMKGLSDNLNLTDYSLQVRIQGLQVKLSLLFTVYLWHYQFPSSSWSCQCPWGCGTVVKRYIIITILCIFIGGGTLWCKERFWSTKLAQLTQFASYTEGFVVSRFTWPVLPS